MVLSVVVGNGLQKRLCVVAEGYSAGIEFGFIRRGCTQRAAVVLVLFLVVVVVDLAGLQTPREYGGLEPFYAGTDKKICALKICTRVHSWKKKLNHRRELTGTFNLHRGKRSALGQVGGVEAQKETQVPFCVDER